MDAHPSPLITAQRCFALSMECHDNELLVCLKGMHARARNDRVPQFLGVNSSGPLIVVARKFLQRYLGTRQITPSDPTNQSTCLNTSPSCGTGWRSVPGIHIIPNNPLQTQQTTGLRCRRMPYGAAAPCGNPYSTMTRFSNVGVEFSTSSSAARALHQGVFVAGQAPVWLLAHRGGYRVHAMDTLEHAKPLAGSNMPPVRSGIAAMAAWNTRKAPASFVVVSAASELRFCHMAKNVRPASWVWMFCVQYLIVLLGISPVTTCDFGRKEDVSLCVVYWRGTNEALVTEIITLYYIRRAFRDGAVAHSSECAQL